MNQALKLRLNAYITLTRLNRPIGTFLVLWPTLWALWLAGGGLPKISNLLIFITGVVLMRSAGCAINDFADRNFDGHVQRTQTRPLALGIIRHHEAVILFVVLCLVSFALVLMTNRQTVYLSFAGAALAFIYPFMKRYTYLPQVVLGAAFSWAIPMAFMAEAGELTSITWLLYTANLLWTVAYDTLYAMVDREDDLKIGVKSTAILFAEADIAAVATLQGLAWLTWVLVGVRAGLGLFYYLALLVAGAMFVWQIWSVRNRDRDACFKAFLHNNWVGAVIFVGIFLNFL
ncbi:4-hydroxybenzoate octaprenyltransferase [Gynuella sunshinyii]|uniref:4-hydroxybenzoate octaprenyltransferase n=1 Tax=Gynuella sunshinyii YC6258 TaxID=1445510 RepID=A0A0C5VEH3_9GAMM|nr:4-hydroxybenzoate octaprenyltransferase [Gynuella sunshinyii]AJQ92957.1 4-hydroxybenzoate polyprenyltransferase and related prenyltransferase [Gynuella sunshinyii YC6258]